MLHTQMHLHVSLFAKSNLQKPICSRNEVAHWAHAICPGIVFYQLVTLNFFYVPSITILQVSFCKTAEIISHFFATILFPSVFLSLAPQVLSRM